MTNEQLVEATGRPIHRCGGGYERVEDAADGRPAFRCTKCGDTWTFGRDGGVYLEALSKRRRP